MLYLYAHTWIAVCSCSTAFISQYPSGLIAVDSVPWQSYIEPWLAQDSTNAGPCYIVVNMLSAWTANLKWAACSVALACQQRRAELWRYTLHSWWLLMDLQTSLLGSLTYSRFTLLWTHTVDTSSWLDLTCCELLPLLFSSFRSSATLLDEARTISKYIIISPALRELFMLSDDVISPHSR